jgi:hypothetical protein
VVGGSPQFETLVYRGSDLASLGAPEITRMEEVVRPNANILPSRPATTAHPAQALASCLFARAAHRVVGAAATWYCYGGESLLIKSQRTSPAKAK